MSKHHRQRQREVKELHERIPADIRKAMKERRMKSLEQRLYEAWRAFSGIRLSPEDMDDLMTTDDAIRSRISNAAAQEAGVSFVPGSDRIYSDRQTWKQLKDEMVEEDKC